MRQTKDVTEVPDGIKEAVFKLIRENMLRELVEADPSRLTTEYEPQRDVYILKLKLGAEYHLAAEEVNNYA
jgi:hypothetical protein